MDEPANDRTLPQPATAVEIIAALDYNLLIKRLASHNSKKTAKTGWIISTSWAFRNIIRSCLTVKISNTKNKLIVFANARNTVKLTATQRSVGRGFKICLEYVGRNLVLPHFLDAYWAGMNLLVTEDLFKFGLAAELCKKVWNCVNRNPSVPIVFLRSCMGLPGIVRPTDRAIERSSDPELSSNVW